MKSLISEADRERVTTSWETLHAAGNRYRAAPPDERDPITEKRRKEYQRRNGLHKALLAMFYK